MVESRLDPSQPMGFAGAGRAEIGIGDALGFFQHTLIPQQECLLAALLQRLQMAGRLLPQELAR